MRIALSVTAVLLISGVAAAEEPNPRPVTVNNFIRAESDLYFSAIALKEGGFGKFEHKRELSPIDRQTIVRLNRDTLYSAAVFDLDAGPVTITLPDAGKRFMSMQMISEDHYTLPAIYEAGRHAVTREVIGTRYALVGIRTLVDPMNPKDMDQARALQDEVKVEQKSRGTFVVPKWDPVSQKKVRDALIVLGATLTDTRRAFGRRDEVDPIPRLISAATTWGGLSSPDAIYLNCTPPKNDGKTGYTLTVKDVPVDAFWSVSLYNAEGYYQKNDLGAYSLNSITAKRDSDGSVTVHFGGSKDAVNHLPIVPGWNYTVRLYRPRKEILDGTWMFPDAQVEK
ncbi:DUF1214 domain-containing protein [Limnoglobus roseus]|uniref:DUF1254 domain-containing protein n=1 Tax=Limnoglobus roseus TaxID=2598579 RepID=A0A5C1ARU2_9BACT|nr:DUF1214 domain-containing protein [Limnoglobus roseus]QEL19954.1 hypothetical protein PX52LOC_07037 [Limnoglobus roseus]